MNNQPNILKHAVLGLQMKRAVTWAHVWLLQEVTGPIKYYRTLSVFIENPVLEAVRNSVFFEEYPVRTWQVESAQVRL